MKADFVARFNEPVQLKAQFTATEMLNAIFGEIYKSGDYDIYNGEYTVTPRVTSITLETREKAMRDNVVVLEIPYREASNPSGGNTVTIG